MRKIVYEVYVKTVDNVEHHVKTEQTHDDIISYDGNYGLISVTDTEGLVYTFALKNIILLKHN